MKKKHTRKKKKLADNHPYTQEEEEPCEGDEYLNDYEIEEDSGYIDYGEHDEESFRKLMKDMGWI